MSLKKFTPLMVLVSSSVWALPHVIPQAKLQLEALDAQVRYVLKDAKGDIRDQDFSSALTPPANWFNLSPKDNVEGVSSEETYLIFGKPQHEVIVAVIDSGVDVNHQSLQGKIWINTKEIPNNGIDDDGNGYVDDVFGWNFIGNSEGMGLVVEDENISNKYRLVKGLSEYQVEYDSLEVTREYVRMKNLKKALESLGEKLSLEQENYLERIKEEVESQFESAAYQAEEMRERIEKYKSAEEKLQAAGLTTISMSVLRNYNAPTPELQSAKEDLIMIWALGYSLERLELIYKYRSVQANFHYNENFNPRLIIGDNYQDPFEKNYGNNDVIGPDASHGTHVAGIIAANGSNANNQVKGVATNVKIMALRVVPNGDERDKDVANAIIYAVDNGAKIINMSFGKKYSPYKRAVDQAVAYAEEKGVILVHSAGNSSEDLDEENNFPSRNSIEEKRDFSNWIEVGASAFKKDKNLAADFSNYGKKSVEIFAPGVNILSATPNDTYATYSGTSMAAPALSGVMAMIYGYDPLLKSDDLKNIVLDSSRRYPNLKVNQPGYGTKVWFSQLSMTGGISDVYEAVNSLSARPAQNLK